MLLPYWPSQPVSSFCLPQAARHLHKEASDSLSSTALFPPVVLLPALSATCPVGPTSCLALCLWIPPRRLLHFSSRGSHCYRFTPLNISACFYDSFDSKHSRDRCENPFERNSCRDSRIHRPTLTPSHRTKQPTTSTGSAATRIPAKEYSAETLTLHFGGAVGGITRSNTKPRRIWN